MAWKGAEVKSDLFPKVIPEEDNVEYVPSWVYQLDAPPQVDDEPWPPSVELAATRNRDGLLLALAVLVIVALLAFALGRASA
jgi:hypothetical protein